MCMHAHKVFISNKIYRKACYVFLKMVIKNVFMTKSNEKNLFALSFRKKLSGSPNNGNPPIKNNGPSLTFSS